MYRKLLVIMIVAGLTLFGHMPAFSFEQQGVVQGNQEIAVFASYYSINPHDSGTMNYAVLGGSYGYFITDPLEVGGQLQLSYSDNDGGDYMPYSLRGFVKYHFFPNPFTIPYVGGALAFSNPDAQGEHAQLGLNVNGGVNIFLTETVAISPELDLDLYQDFTMVTTLIQLKAYF